MSDRPVSKKILEALVAKMVAEKLSELSGKFADLTKNFSVQDQLEASELTLQLLDEGVRDYLNKMKVRLDVKKQSANKSE